MWCAVPVLWSLIMDRPGAGYRTRGQLALIVCRRENQVSVSRNAEGQRHAAVVAERKLRPQMALVHPPGAAARKAVFRRAAFQPDGLYLTERKGACKAGAGRFEEGSFAAKSAAALAAL